MWEKIKEFIKKEFVLVIAGFLTLISCFIVKIDREYINYINYDTIISLFCMLTVISGLKSTNIFEFISKKLVGLFSTRRTVIMALVLGTFFFDMIVANDMSLITFLPLTYLVLHSTGNDKYLAYTFILQTIAANMGGMITPYGNPQNLYLYSYYNIPIMEFLTILIKQSIAVIILLIISCLFIKNDKLELKDKETKNIDKRKLLIYGILFIISILSIFRVIPLIYTFITIIVVMFIVDKKVFKKVDYALLLTFVVFFIFTGNIARIPIIQEFIKKVISSNVLLSGIISCQFISNVPTAIFISKFTNNYKDLLISVNIGSLGIIISSLASLITLKEFLKHQPNNSRSYLLIYTIVNTIFLIILTFITKII